MPARPSIAALSAALLLAALCGASGRALAVCKIGKLAELPITMRGSKPLVAAKINGAEALFVADSGAFYSLIAPASAQAFNLKLRVSPVRITLTGVGGTSDAWVTTVKEFTLAGTSFADTEFIVGGNDPGSGAVGFLGQNILQMADAEYDLANGVIRLMRPNDCDNAMLAYWAGTDRPYSVIDINRTSPSATHTTGTAFINGKRIKVMFDTGASTSMVTLRAAQRVGVTPEMPGVVSAGLARGIGQGAVKTWIAPFASFRVGDEEVKNTKLRIADLHIELADMLIGADFFLSHRIYVSTRQRKVYFTYNGGPVFNLMHFASDAAGARPEDLPRLPAESGPTLESGATVPTAEPTDAAGFARRGAASAARHDYDRAIADLTRASDLDPQEPQYFYDRGVARLNVKEPALAFADFEKTLELKPSHVAALVARAELLVASGEADAAIANLETADQNAAREADVRLQLGNLFARAAAYEQAVEQYTLWLATHDRDGRKADVLNGRCRARALWGEELKQGQYDCDVALKLRPRTAHFLDSRALVHLRMGHYDASIADYDAVLKEEPRNAWALYGRGIGKLRQGQAAAGQADIDTAVEIHPPIAEEARRRGLTP